MPSSKKSYSDRMKKEESIYCFESLSDENIDDILKFVNDASSDSFGLVSKRCKDILESHNKRKETFRYPPTKKYPAGKRIKIILGKTGAEYIMLCNRNDGKQDQILDFEYGRGGITYEFYTKFNYLWRQGRIITGVVCGCDSQWYVDGKYTDGSVSPRYYRSNIGQPFDSYFEKNLERRTSVAIGDDDCWLIISGEYNYKSNNLNPHLEKRLKDMNRRKRTIHFVRLFPLGGYFISDADGTLCSNLTDDLTMEVKRECPDDPITDVVVARDQSWIVLRENSYVASSTICDDLKTDLDKSYAKYNFKNNE